LAAAAVAAVLPGFGAAAALGMQPSLMVSGTKVSWNTGSGSPGEVRVTGEDGQEKVFALGAPSGEQDAPWLAGGGRYVFRLYCPRLGTVIATVAVARSDARPKASGDQSGRQTGTCPPPSSPAALNQALRLLPFGLLALLAAGLAWYFRTRRWLAT
jgi:hypothetical protein